MITDRAMERRFSFSVIAALALLLIIWCMLAWDRPIMERVAAIRAPAATDVANLVSLLGNPTPYAVLAALLFLVFKGGRPDSLKANRALFMLSVAGAPGLTADLLKLLFGRSRPDLYLEHGVYEFRTFHNDPDFASFPSEHAAVVWGLATAFSLLFPAYRATFILLAAIVAACRVLLLEHYPSDVIAGALVGAGMVLLIRALFTAIGMPLHLRQRRAIYEA